MSLFVPMPFHHRYQVSAADFDGTNDFMTRGAGLTGAADAKVGIISFWFKADATTNSTIFNAGAAASDGGLRIAGGVLETGWQNAGSGTGFEHIIQSTATLNTTAWHHVIFAWDRATAFNKVYYDGVDTTTGVVTSDAVNDYTKTDWGVGAETDGGVKYDGGIADLYVNLAETLDITVAANLAKFISNGRPVPLGTDGSIPTGNAPICYFHLDKGETAANFATNRGTGGNFTVTGALSTYATSPTD